MIGGLFSKQPDKRCVRKNENTVTSQISNDFPVTFPDRLPSHDSFVGCLQMHDQTPVEPTKPLTEYFLSRIYRTLQAPRH